MSASVLHYGDPINRSHPLSRGLVGRWQVVPWYASGPRWMDLAGVGRYHGTLATAPTWDSDRGRQGGMGSLKFTRASSQYVEVPTPVVTVEPFTLACWFRSVDTANTQVLISIGDTGVANGDRYVLFADGSSVSDLVIATSRAGGSANSANSATGYTSGNWHFATGVWAAANSRTVYIDGGNSGTNSVSRSPAGLDVTRLGSRAAGTNADFFDGHLDCAMIFNRALAADEVIYLRDCTRRRDDPTLNWIRPVTYFGVTPAVTSKTGTDDATLSEASQVNQALTDAGTLAEASPTGLADTDAGTAAEAAQVGPTDADATALAEAMALVLPTADAASLAEAGLIGPTELDAGALDEAVVVAAGLAGTDAGTLDDDTSSIFTGAALFPWMLHTGRVY